MAFLVPRCYAGGVLPVNGARSYARGGCSVTESDIWSVSNNQAAIVFIKKPAVAFFYRNRFNVEGTANQNITAAIPYGIYAFGGSLSYYGNSDYHEQKIAFSMSAKPDKNFSFGLSGNYNSVFIKDYGSWGVVTVDGGMLAKLSPKVTAGFHVLNLLRGTLKNSSAQPLPVIYKCGIGYRPSTKLLVATEVKIIDGKSCVCSGIEYLPATNLSIMAGISTLQPQFSFGVGFTGKNYRIDVSSVIHQYLGVSHQVSLVFEIVKKTSK